MDHDFWGAMDAVALRKDNSGTLVSRRDSIKVLLSFLFLNVKDTILYLLCTFLGFSKLEYVARSINVCLLGNSEHLLFSF